MAQRSTRNKIRFQVDSARADLEKAQDHFATAAGLADGKHPTIEKDLPMIMAALQLVIEATDKFYLGL